MKTRFRILASAAIFALSFGLAAPARAQAADPDAYGDGYQSGAYGRVLSADAGATLIRAGEENPDPNPVNVNSPLFPGDALRTDGNQRVEVQLADGTTIRVDRDSELAFQSLPNPSASFKDNTVLTLNRGVIRIAVHSADKSDKDEFRVDTPGASVYLLDEGDFRIDTDGRQGTQVASLHGVAEVVGNDSSVLVRGGMRTVVDAGAAPATPRAYTAYASDGFDRWCDARNDGNSDRYVWENSDREEVPDEVRPYYSELSNNGEFVEDTQYGTVWYPRGVASGWRPYVDGYWNYGPSGYFWVSSEPWGWAPYHYGNWQWTLRGWCWVPGRVFAGAWVSWSWGPSYVGWAPLDYWGGPAWIGGPIYYGYYDPGCWTFVNYNHLASHHVGRYAVPIGSVRDDLRHATVVTRPPQVDPRRIAQSPVIRDKALRRVADDQSARMQPIDMTRRPDRRLADVQTHLMRRPQATPSRRIASRESMPGSSVDRSVNASRARRILEDPRPGARPSENRPRTRDDVRDLYQRMSKPRETRGQGDEASPRTQPMRRNDPPMRRQDPQRADPRASDPRREQRADVPRREAPRQEAPRSSAPRSQAPPTMRESPRREEPRMQGPSNRAPREQAPRGQAPRQQQPRREAPRPQRPPPSKEHGNGNGNGNGHGNNGNRHH
jgi:hypothetical protein